MKNKPIGEIFIFLVIMVTGFAACELYVRIYLKHEIDTSFLKEVFEKTYIGPYIQTSRYPELFYELKPSFNISGLGQYVFTDENGCRISSPSYKNNSKVKYKVAVIGDSSAFGFGINNENSYAEIFKTKLEDYFKNKIELRNYSVPGYNTYQEAICIEKKIIPWQPDLIILHYDHNDPDPTLTVKPVFLEPEYGDNFLKSALLKFLKRKIKIIQNKNLEIFRHDNKDVAYFDKYRIAGPLYYNHKQALLKIKNDCENGKIKLLVIIFDAFIKNEILFSNEHYLILHKPLLEFFNSAGINYLDLYPEYQKIMNRNKWKDLSPFWLSKKYHDAHPNELGHKFISNELAKFVIIRNILR